MANVIIRKPITGCPALWEIQARRLQSQLGEEVTKYETSKHYIL